MVINITPEVSKVVKELAKIQIGSFQRILNGEYQLDDEDKEILTFFNATWVQVSREAKVKIEHYKDLYKEPLLIGATEDIDLSILRHLLFHLEDYFISLYGVESVNDLWDIFFKIEEERSLTLKINRKTWLKDSK